MDRTCTFPNCSRDHSPGSVMCKRHWLMLPQRARNEIKSCHPERAMDWIRANLSGEIAMLKAKAVSA